MIEEPDPSASSLTLHGIVTLSQACKYPTSILDIPSNKYIFGGKAIAAIALKAE
ncbi:MAG: hypothetical protein ACK41Q_09665 [Candidatus Brocadia sp.]